MPQPCCQQAHCQRPASQGSVIVHVGDLRDPLPVPQNGVRCKDKTCYFHSYCPQQVTLKLHLRERDEVSS